MKRLRYDVNRNVYVDDIGNRIIENRHVSVLGDQHRLENNFLDRNAALEEEVKKVLRELFPRRVIQPNAYALANLGYFYTLDFLFAPESSYVSLAVSEKAAK